MKHIFTEDDEEVEDTGVLSDGESVRVPLLMIDSARRAQIIRDASSGSGVGYRRGFQFAGPCIIDDAATLAARDKAARSYEARKERLANAWRDRKEVKDPKPEPRPAPRSLTDAPTAAAAYRAKCERLSNAWRNKR
jgi:hypothetical protein